MRYFNDLSELERASIFYQSPWDIEQKPDKETLAYALGATLYVPATKVSLAMFGQKYPGLTSMVICLEDGISDHMVEQAENRVISQLVELRQTADAPYIFLRVRNLTHFKQLSARLGVLNRQLTGYVFPKFTAEDSVAYFETLQRLNQQFSVSLFGMPILESDTIIYKETRMDTLLAIKATLDHYHDLVLNVRIGATDFSGLYGLRRRPDTTIYELSVVRDCIADIANVFLRKGKEYVISGPVYEYFDAKQRDGLIREVLQDQENGFHGKTIIHPAQIKPIQALHVVDYEDYIDAKAIIASTDNGVIKSDFSNKMNEVKPHYRWAQTVLKKSKIFGVYHEQQNYRSLLTEQIPV